MAERTHVPTPDPLAGREHAAPPHRPAADKPFWLTDICPRWCTGVHAPGEHPEDRAHWSDTREVPLLLELATHTPDGVVTPQRLKITVRQHCREAEPAVLLSVGDSGREIALSFAETSSLLHVLRQTLAAATPDLETLPEIPADWTDPRTGRRGAEPWTARLLDLL